MAHSKVQDTSVPLAKSQASNGDVQATGNKGHSIQATDAMEMIGWDSMTIADWHKRENINNCKTIKLLRLSHMRYMHPDFTNISKFLVDFGMQIVKQSDEHMWWRGSSAEPYVYVAEKGPEKKFLGGAWVVQSYADLEKYADSLAPICCVLNVLRCV